MAKIRVALIDNMNNNFFSFARYLRDFDIDAHVYEIPNSSMMHFRPDADTFENVSNLEWINSFPANIHKLTIDWILFIKKQEVFTEFNNYDLVVSCGASSAFLERSGISSDIIVPHGSDLFDLPFRSVQYGLSTNSLRSLAGSLLAKYQRSAYKKARVLSIFTNTPLYGESKKTGM